jgi:hypothetical protein
MVRAKPGSAEALLTKGDQIVRRFCIWRYVAILFVVIVALIAAALFVGERKGIHFDRNPLRVIAAASAVFRHGCTPAERPLFCRQDGVPWLVQSPGADWSIRQEGANGIRFELRSGDRWPKDVRQNHAVERVEIMDLRKQAPKGEFWFAFVFSLDKGDQLTSEWLNLGQLHNTADAGELSPSPIWAQRLYPNGTFQIVARWTDEDPLKSAPREQVLFTDPAFTRGKRYHFVYRMRLDYQGAGVLQAWRNGRQIIDYRGPLGFPDKSGPYLKFGLYRKSSSIPVTLVGHYSDIVTSDRVIHP